MSSLQQNLILFTGISASFVIACGSLYLLHNCYNGKKFPFATNFKKRSKDCLDRIVLHKQVPIMIYDQYNGFHTIEKETSTLIESKSCEFWSKDPDVFTENDVQYYNECNNFNQHLSIQGFREDVFEASQLIDKLVENSAAQTPTLQVFQVRTNQVSAIVGRNGTTVRTIEKQSGARVIVVKRNTSSNDLFTSIKVSGTALQIKEAYRLIDLYLTRERRNTQFKYVDDEDDSDFESFIDLSLISSPPCSSSSANFNKRINLSQLGQLTETLEASSKSDALSLPCKVFVSHIVSPIEFYVIINDSRGRKFDKLQCDMVEFFSVSQNRKLCQCHHSEADLSGQIVAVCRRVELTSDFNYFRGFVTKVMAENQLQVYLVDLGQTEVLPCDQLFYLNDTFVQMLPFQAIKCSLENFGSQSTWNDLQMDRFRQLTREGLWEDVGLRCFGKNGQTHVVELFRELRNETINIGVELVAS